MKKVLIGGQAVLEGIMMRNGADYAIAVRREDGDIALERQEFRSVAKGNWAKLPLLRGIIAFVDSMKLGFYIITRSAEMLEAPAEPTELSETEPAKAKQGGLANALMIGFSVIMALGLFIALPYGLSLLLRRYIPSQTVLTILEGVIRLSIFLLYISLTSLLADMKRVYMYHGAEHKCINCLEHDMELTVENVMKSSRFHKRCGTSFLVIIMVITIVIFMAIRVEAPLLRLALRIVVIPLVAGISFEFLRLAGLSDHPLVNLLSKPGLWVQRITTKEPTADMVEVAIAAVQAVWQPDREVGALSIPDEEGTSKIDRRAEEA